MAKKITCPNCGHSWDKSTSTAKDAHVCHICGKGDVNMKDGGWLDKYEKAENGIEGTMGGLTDKGFNYNGAWGGPSMQVGGTVLKFLEPTSKKLPEGYNPSPMARGTSTEYAVSIGGEDGEPAYLIPSFKHGELLLDPKAEFRRTGEHLGGPFKTYQEADEWERTVRHPYVEKGQSIPTPIKRWGKDFAMGGSLPGTVGFTYARTGSIPSNGPYAKKTKASAQNGQEMKFYQEGLDWKPRNISRNGSEIPQAQVGTMVTPLDFSKPIGTLEGVSEVMSAPARTATYLLTGKYQDPSQALGIKNPWGALAVDMVLDPVNLVSGAGLAKIAGKVNKANKATKVATQASKKSGVLSKAYKEVSKPTSSFKSEIDWGKWNPDTPKYPELINEYNAIEQSTKKAGTWMKNPDGSAFQGTPEQFIQQQSSWFKKAFPDGFNTTYRGANNNATFRGNLALSDNPNLGAVFAGNKNSAVPKYGSFDRVIRPDELGKSHQGTPGYMQLAYKPSSNSVGFTAKMSNWDNIDRSLLPIEHRNMKAATQVARENPSIVTTDDIARHIQDKDLDYAKIENINDGTFFGEEIIYNHKPNNYLKSLWHNVGFFDMTNPNIYKGLVPTILGGAAAASIDKKKKGGKIKKDDNGYWNPENWGEPVEIGSNNITMQGVYQPLLGISDEGDVQYMEPGKDYKFKGKKVTEYPIAQNGKDLRKAYFKSPEERDVYRKRLKEVSESAISNLGSDENLLLGTSYHNIDAGNNCINGICGLNLAAGLKYNKPTDQDRFLSGEKFAQAVAKGDEDYYQVDGNFQVGDMLQYRKKRGSTSHNKIIYDSFVNADGEKMYKVIDNSGGKTMKTDNYTEAELKKMQLEGAGGYDKVNIYRPGYNIDRQLIEKEREARTSPEARKALAARKERIDWETSNDPGYKYSIREDSKYYKNQPEGMREFIKFANNDRNINNLVEKLGVDKGVIHDELLNTFGELGQENKWEDRLFGGTGGIENTIETIFKPKSWSIGPGQIKFNTIDPELKKKFNINKPKDLYDFEKVIPLMTAMNIKNRQWMERKGENLSESLIGEPGVGASDLEGGVGRWTPYMYRGSLRNPVNVANAELSGTDLYGQELKNERNRIIREKASLFDKGSYAANVFDNINENLQRTLPEGYFDKPQEMQPIKVTSKKKRSGGWLDKYK